MGAGAYENGWAWIPSPVQRQEHTCTALTEGSLLPVLGEPHPPAPGGAQSEGR